MKNILLTIIIGMFLFSLASVSAIDNIGTFQTETSFDLIQFCDSCTYVNISGIQLPNGTLQNLNEEMTKTGYNYNYTYSTSTAGDYVYSVCGDKDAGFKCETFQFGITEGGVILTEGRSTLVVGLLLTLVLFLFISLFAMFSVENYIAKFSLYWVSHLLLVLISFVAWQVGVEGLLGGTALTGIFRIMFWVILLAVLPMIFISMAWIFYIHAFNEHFQKLVDKGMDTESAFKMAKKKSGGWFNGK